MTTVDRAAAAPPVRDQSAKRRWVGQSIRRVEDPKFLLGRGGYIADRITPGTLHAAVLRSPHAHARIVRIEAAQAKAAPGVHAVITGAEAAELCDPMPDFGPDPARHTWRCLAAEKVRYVGEGVAVVVADSRYLAEDALELIEVEYEPLPPVTDPERALADGAPLVHEALESNCAYERTFDFGDVDRDFAEADLVVRDRLRWHRSGGQPLETVGAIAEYDPGTGSFTIDTNTLSFTSYLFMAAGTLKVPANKLDIRPVPAGGSFGSKLFANKPAVIAAMCARQTGRKVAYLEDRVDNISNCDHHGSDRVYEVELAVMRDGTMRGIKIDVIDDYGAYIQFGVGHHGNALAQVVGPYTIGSVRYRVRAALTNKNQQGAYRGFGSEVNNWMLEQMVELAARELGLDPVAVRRKNFIREFPHFIPTGNVYDSGDYDRVLDKALELADYGHWRAEQKRLREEEGRYIGIGLISAQERSVFSATEFWFWFDEPGAPVTSTPESVSLKVDATGGITAILYSCAFWGNSPETMVSQFVAEEFDCSPYDVSVVYHGSRDGLPATGPGGSRTTVMLAGAVEGAAGKIKEKARRAAAHLLEIDPDDMEWSDGGFQVRGDPERKKSLAEIAIALHLFKHSFPADMESGLDESKVFDHPYTTMPSADRKDLGVFYPFMGHACHVPVVEVDIETGAVTFLHYAAVHDCGTLVNPRSLAGHIVGGTAQGIGTALYEEYVYDDDGQLLSSSYLDYLIPSAMEVPELTIGHVENAVAVHAARRQGRRRGRPDDGAGRDQRRGQRRAVPARRPPHRAADDPRADPVSPASRRARGRRGRVSPPASPVPPVAVVTGANRGIGRAITVAFAAAGFAVAAGARDLASLADTVAEAERAGGSAVPVACDVRDEASVEALAARAERIGPVRAVVANAGVAGPTAPLHEITLEDWRETLAIDLDGVFLTFRAFIPAMIQRRAGSLIAISSMTGKRPLHGRTPYAAAKMGVIGLVRTLATELGPHDIRVNAVCPGFVAGPRIEQVLRRQAAVRGIAEETVRAEVTALSPLRRMVRPEEVAATCVYLASGDSAGITGEDLNVTAGVVMY